MAGSELLESTRQLLEEPLLGDHDLDAKVRLLLKAEYFRRLGQYRRVDHLLNQKYGLTFEEFTTRRIVQEKGYGWEVESDAVDWETAIAGIRTIERKLADLQDVDG